MITLPLALGGLAIGFNASAGPTGDLTPVDGSIGEIRHRYGSITLATVAGTQHEFRDLGRAP